MTKFNFSYTQEIYDEIKEHGRRYLGWTNKEKTWHYENCTVTVIGLKNLAHIVLRRERTGKSNFKNSRYVLNLMMGFTATGVQKNYRNSVHELTFTIQQTNDRNHRDLKDVKIWSDDKNAIEKLYDTIQDKMQNPDLGGIIAPDYQEKNTEIIPVIYQPRIDAWENFLREINVHKEDDGSYMVILAFQGEVLRKFFPIDPFYKLYRFFRFRRTVDIEHFSIRGDKFYFENIYSGINTIFDDSTHIQAEAAIRYYFSEKNHPVIFINTSNHAMAPHDNNHDFWKWEYVPWSKTVPIKLGKKTLEETEKSYRRF